MPDTAGEKYQLYLSFGSGWILWFNPIWKDGDPYFPGYELWDNRYHKGDGPLFHARSFSPPPSQYITDRFGDRRLYLGSDLSYDGRDLSYILLDGKDVRQVSATVFKEGDRYRARIVQASINSYRLGEPRPDVGEGVFQQYTGSAYYDSGWGAFYYASLEDLVAFGLSKLPGSVPLEPWGVVRPQQSYDAHVAPFPASKYQFNFRHNEWDAYMGSQQLDADLFPNLYRSGFSSAYINAMEDIPEIQCNNIANLLDIVDLLRNIKKMNFSKFVKEFKNWRELWLSYRYVVNTTKADIEETYDVVSRVNAVLKSSKPFKVRGTFRKDEMLFRCTVTLDPSVLLPSDTSSYLKKAGLELNAYNAWDLVPYSFVVDWFLHIGDLIEWAERFSEGVEVPIRDCWYSYESAYSDAIIYFRVKCSGILGTPFLTTTNASDRTLLMRFTDAVALFTK